jgi:hypothetical protein
MTTLTAFSTYLTYGDSNAADISSLARTWQIVVSSIAFVLNIIVLTTLIRIKDILPSTTRIIMIHQSVLEVLCSILAVESIETQSLTVNPLPLNGAGNFACVTWSTIYWVVEDCVQINCVLITIDRYCAVCYPLKRVFTTRSTVVAIIVDDIVTGIAVNAANYYTIGIDINTGLCVPSYLPQHLLRIWGVVGMLAFGLSPIIAVMVCYPQMVHMCH